MKFANHTINMDFFMVGFSDFPHFSIPLFIIFLFIYITTLCGNILIVSLVCYESQLHTPMYFFLCNLSLIDVTFTTAIFPKMLANFFVERSYVSLKICLVQLYFFISMLCSECLLLTVMAYDRFVAICEPLRYAVIMNRALCCRLASGAMIFSFIEPIPYTVMTSELDFCGSHQINHFFCDITALMKISCTSTQNIETLIYVIGGVVGLIALPSIIISYIHIISAILKIQSAEGRSKTFSTCASHLTVVNLFFGSLIIMYLRPTSMNSMNQNKIFSLLYCVVVPLFNPIIYSLKNKELRETFRKIKDKNIKHAI